VVIEEFLEGEIGSLFALCDGTTSMLFGWAQDHKRASTATKGPNTGGMGTYSPAPVFTPQLVDQVRERLAERAFAGIAADGAPYRGVLFVELMATAAGPKLVEFNVRFGDPECQVLMLRLESDLVPYLLACATGRLAEMPPPAWRDARRSVSCWPPMAIPPRRRPAAQSLAPRPTSAPTSLSSMLGPSATPPGPCAPPAAACSTSAPARPTLANAPRQGLRRGRRDRLPRRLLPPRHRLARAG
jgi:hypothetical protein